MVISLKRVIRMNNLKVKLTVSMIITTIGLFIVTFLFVYFYQKNHIFDKAIYSIENELNRFSSYDESPEEELLNRARFFDVEVIFPNDEEAYLSTKEKELLKIYKSAEYTLGEVGTAKNNFGEFYYLIEEVYDDFLFDERQNSSINSKIPILLYIDITSSINVVKRINYIFFVMLIASIVIEGLVGIYIGSSFEKSQKRLKHFFENASHELKTPLMSIMGYAEGIKTDVISDKKMASDVIIRKSEKMKLLIDEILNISKLDSREYVLKNDNVDLVDIVEESLENFKLIKEEKNISLKFDISSEIREIKADALQIYKAVNTIIDNAFKFARARVDVKLYNTRKYVYLEIYNDGENISEENAKHIFDRFYSAGDFSTGIGLAMAKEILILSGGDIDFKNKDDGVSFILKFIK